MFAALFPMLYIIHQNQQMDAEFRASQLRREAEEAEGRLAAAQRRLKELEPKKFELPPLPRQAMPSTRLYLPAAMRTEIMGKTATRLPERCMFREQIPIAPPAPVVEDVVFTSVDELYEHACLTEEDEWDVRFQISKGRAKLEERDA